MCGLFMSTDPRVLSHAERISALLERRGTEGVSWHQAPNGSLYAHSLLPIRGKNPCQQPVVDRKGVFLFTGELWDVPPGEADTLVLLDRLREQGVRRAVRRTRGTWAVVYWDARSEVITFATDWFGEQPLHYAIVEDHLYIGSEIKLLVAAGLPLKAIHHVEPGKLYRFQKALEIQPLVAWTSHNRWKNFDPQKLRDRIARAIAEQALTVDLQNIGILISGGIDSTIVAYEAARLGIRRAWTVATDPEALDAIQARLVAKKLDLDWNLVLAKPAPPETGIAVGEVSNRSIVEELCMHATLAGEIAKRGVRVVLTGSGADEVFVGYGHLLGRVHSSLLQQRFLSTYFRYDLRALNKLFMGFGIEPRNPFLSRTVVEYALQMHGELLLGPHHELKWPLRVAYAELLEHVSESRTLIARETMGAKKLFEAQFGTSPYVYRKMWRRILEDPVETVKWLVGRA